MSQKLSPDTALTMDSELSCQTEHKQRRKMQKNKANSRNSSDKCCPRVAHKCKGEQNIAPQPGGQPSKMQRGEIHTFPSWKSNKHSIKTGGYCHHFVWLTNANTLGHGEGREIHSWQLRTASLCSLLVLQRTNTKLVSLCRHSLKYNDSGGSMRHWQGPNKKTESSQSPLEGIFMWFFWHCLLENTGVLLPFQLLEFSQNP